jgi:hypothetical protein
MWVQKTPTEVSLEKRIALLRATGLDILLGVGLWYGLVRFAMFFGLLSRKSFSVYIGCAVIAVILPATWYSSRRAWRKRASTMVCDRCNAVKTADNQSNCNCGGHYFPLQEMKWVDDAPSRRNFSMRAESHI